jgi:methionine-rich copper-binding protein CopC
MKYKILSLACFLSIALAGQTPTIINCKIINNYNASFNSVNTHCQYSINDYPNVPEITINVNFHILPNRFATNADAVFAAKLLLNNLNKLFENMGQYDLSGPNGIIVPWVQKAKVKLKLYSEPTNTEDILGGIWLYNNGNWIDRYAGRALNIRLESGIAANGSDLTRQEGASPVGTGISRDLRVADFFSNRASPIQFFPATLAHEIGHTLGLTHPTWCFNECSGIDIEPANECNSLCPQTGTCNRDFFDNAGPGQCTGGGNLCLVCDRSNNLTGSCFKFPKAITPCQWTTIFNDVLHGGAPYALLCFTAATFILPTSPLNDYRASQSITSTSLVSGDRMVDYWSPSITLNPGFRVDLGTTFLASPTTFPCCNPVVGLVKNNTQVDALPAKFNIVPNPFGDYIQIDYQIDNDLDKVELTMTDITGKIIKTIPVKSQNKGQYQVEVKTDNLSNGIYFIQYQSNGTVSTQKIVKANKN